VFSSPIPTHFLIACIWLKKCDTQCDAQLQMPVHKRIFRGRFRQAGRKYLALPLLQDIRHRHVSTASFMLHCGMLCCLADSRSASMGSHFAPALCGLVAAFQEYCFHRALQGMGTQQRLLDNSRYVGQSCPSTFSRLETTTAVGFVHQT